LLVLRDSEGDRFLHDIGLGTVTLHVGVVFDISRHGSGTKAAQSGAVEGSEVIAPDLDWGAAILGSVSRLNPVDSNLRVVVKANRVD